LNKESTVQEPACRQPGATQECLIELLKPETKYKKQAKDLAD